MCCSKFNTNAFHMVFNFKKIIILTQSRIEFISLSFKENIGPINWKDFGTKYSSHAIKLNNRKTQEAYIIFF